MPRQRWVPNRGKQTAAPLSSERDRTRAELLHRKSSQCTQISPQGHHVRAPCPNKRCKDCVCHRGGSRFYPHTILKRLASARHLIERKLYSYQIAHFKQTSQWRRKSWWCILPAALILWHAGSDVMGCCRPTGGVFTYVSSDRVTLRAFPVATPRGRSSSSHEGESQFPLQGNIFLTITYRLSKIDLLWALRLLYADDICFCWSHQFGLFQLIIKIFVFNCWICGVKTTFPMMLCRKLNQSELQQVNQAEEHSMGNAFL